MRKLILILSTCCWLMAGNAMAAMDSYCHAPPFISSAAAPNVLLSIDTSTSMGWKAYSYGGVSYDSSKVYEGYFDPAEYYAKNATGVYEITAAGGTCTVQCGPGDNKWECKSSTNNVYYWEEKGSHGCNKNRYATCTEANLQAKQCGATDTGNYLNWQKMARTDLLRWALTGGTPQGCDGSIQRCEPSLWLEPSSSVSCDVDGCVLETNDGELIRASWNRITGPRGGLLYQLQALNLQPRMGAMFWSGAGVNENVLVGDFTGSASVDAVNPYKNTITALNSQDPNGYTPMGPALWAAYAYFAQEPSIYGSPGPMTGGSEWKNPMYQCFDEDGDGNCQGNELQLVSCAKNFMILLTDGQWNVGGPKPDPSNLTCNIDNGFERPSADPVVPAYWMHKKGFTNKPTGVQSKVEALYGIGLWLGGSGEQSLKNVSMYGGFDTNQTWPGNTTGFPMDENCAAPDCFGNYVKGSPCTPLPPSSPDWDSDADGNPDTFFGAADANQIKQRILTIIYEIMRRASSGTAVSVLSSSEGTGANLMQALFYPKRSFADSTEVSWSSDLMNYWYYLDPFFAASTIREDTVREGDDSGTDPYTLLNLQQDYITSFAYDPTVNKTLAQRWFDPTGKSDALVDEGQVPIEKTVPIWRAGFNLWWSDPATRHIYTSLDVEPSVSSIPQFPAPSLTKFDPGNSASLMSYLGQTTTTEAATTINYSRGYDCFDALGTPGSCDTAGFVPLGRTRTVTSGVCSSRKNPCESVADCRFWETCNKETHVWKLGDIISSTPRIMGPGSLNTYDEHYPFGYSDNSYGTFIKSDDYNARQLAFVGANDGMLHAFKLGKLIQKWTGKQWFEVAKQEGPTGAGGIGSESYAFVPKNVLPYLQYLYDEQYCHIYMVDGPTALTDASINTSPSCILSDYWECPKVTTLQSGTNTVDPAETSWRTTLVGSIGLGGATCDAATPDVDRISTPISVGGSPVGWSSYFALDVTDQAAPEILWEFSNPDLGVTNVGPAIIRVGHGERCAISNQVCSTDTDCGDTTLNGKCVPTNGRWFAVLASGSTGPISKEEFKGTSDKNLKLFVLDLKTGALLRTIDTGITNAFAGSVSSSALDLQKDRPLENGNYEDDALYIGYVQNTVNGGVLRLVINNDIDPANWTTSSVIDGIGPITTSVVNLLDRRNQKLWLFFGEGRFFYKTDDLTTQRRLYGVAEPCFDGMGNTIDPACTKALTLADLKDQTISPSSSLTATEQGWYISMDPGTAPWSAERIISNPTPDTGGAIYFLTFSPTGDICSFGGTTFLWALDYKTGGRVTFKMQGKALVQVSTGEIKELDLGQALTEEGGRKSKGFKGIPPTGQGLMVVKNPTPLREFIHVQEQ